MRTEDRLSAEELDRIRRARRHPRTTQFDYLHLRRLLRDLRAAFSALPDGVHDVLDVYCGTRPYEDLLPQGSRSTGLDVTDRYGAADVVTDEFLPFPDASFDLALCVEAFHYVVDPEAAAAELARVLRPSGSLIISVPLVWEYDRGRLEHRFTGPQLADLFKQWEAVNVVENGGRGVTWSTQTGRILTLAEASLTVRLRELEPMIQRGFACVYLIVNAVGALIERADHRWDGPMTMPMNLLLTARRP